MGRKAKELKALDVGRLTDPGMNAVGVPAGLYLLVKPTGARSWIFRKMIDGRRRDMGLGAYPDVLLADAQRKARELAELIRDGRDPLAERRAAVSAREAERLKARTFRQVADEYIAAHESGWKNAKHSAQWSATLETYAHPIIGSLAVGDVERAHVLQILTPIWKDKNETATRLRSRIELVIGYAMQQDYLPGGLNPARWRDNLDKALPKPGKVAKVEHHPALPIDQMPAFMSRLRAMPGMGARALEFVALTAARSGEVRGATWAEVDLDAGLFTVPASRMKTGKEHRVPLSADALKLLEGLPRGAPDALVFPSTKGTPLSDMTLTACMRRMELEAVPHGLRSTFRDWVAERTSYPGDLAEMALAHAVGNAVEAAYRRGDMVERRRQMMDAWALFLAVPVASNVVPVGRKVAA